jgi:hypothetical protein
LDKLQQMNLTAGRAQARLPTCAATHKSARRLIVLTDVDAELVERSLSSEPAPPPAGEDCTRRNADVSLPSHLPPR